MNDLIIYNIKPAQEDILADGLFLLVIHADKTPPHLAISNDGEIFSLKVTGPETTSASAFKRTTSLKKIPVLYFQISTTSKENVIQSLIKNYLSGISPEDNSLTCLAPLRSLFSKIFSEEFLNAETLFDLLPMLYQNKLIKNVYGENTETLPDKSFTIKFYDIKIIHDRISELKKHETTI